MNRILVSLGFLAAAASPDLPWRGGAVSPRIELLAKQIKAGDSAAVDLFWAEMKDRGTPLVEPLPRDSSHVLLTFVYRSHGPVRSVGLKCQLNTTRDATNVLTRLPNTDVWYKTYWMRSDLRFSYGFAPDPAEEVSGERDPLNPKTLAGGSGIGPSIAELPAAPPQLSITPEAGVPKGKLEREDVVSKILKATRGAWIYTPAGFDPTRSKPYALLICFDGSIYTAANNVPVPVILDNLIAQGKIPPTIGVFIIQSPQPQRNLELDNNESFLNFVADELLPDIRKKWHVTSDPSQTVVCGSSAGGLASLFFAFRRPDVFGNVLAQSAALWPGKERDNPDHEWLTRQYESSPKLPIRVVLQPGVLEVVSTPLNGPSILSSNRRLRDLLTAKGYEIHYSEIAGGHEPLTWRGGIAPGLLQLLGQVPQVKVSANVLISKAHADLFHGEIWFAADPNNTKRLMGGSMVYDLQKDLMRSVAYVSLDGGQSWDSPFVTGESTDPACAYGIDGAAYWLHLKREGDRYMEIFKSMDGGKTWLKPQEAPYLDREYMTVDDTRGKHRGRLYIHAHQAGKEDPSTRDIVLFHSDDGGARFTDIVAGPAPEKQFANPGNAAILSDGTFIAVHADLRNGREKPDPAAGLRQRSGSIALVTSSDGEHLSEPWKISDWYYPFSENGRLSYIPVIAADRSSGEFRDRLYVVWTDSRSGRAEVYLTWSSDRGRTWSVPKPVNDDAPRLNGASPNNFHAAVAVNKDGIVGVSWYDRRESPDDLGWRQRFAASLDGGVTFSPSVAVSEALYDPSRNDPSRVNEKVERTVLRTGAKFMYPRWAFVNNGGDTGSIVADANGAFHAFWADNRTGTAQLWTSIVTVEKSGK